MKSEAGTSLLETLVALALLGIVGVAFLGGLATSSSSRTVADEHASARILAESQIENLKEQEYLFSYSPIPIPADYPGYSANVIIDNMRNSKIQKITVTIMHHGENITTLESYKVDR